MTFPGTFVVARGTLDQTRAPMEGMSLDQGAQQQLQARRVSFDQARRSMEQHAAQQQQLVQRTSLAQPRFSQEQQAQLQASASAQQLALLSLGGQTVTAPSLGDNAVPQQQQVQQPQQQPQLVLVAQPRTAVAVGQPYVPEGIAVAQLQAQQQRLQEQLQQQQEQIQHQQLQLQQQEQIRQQQEQQLHQQEQIRQQQQQIEQQQQQIQHLQQQIQTQQDLQHHTQQQQQFQQHQQLQSHQQLQHQQQQQQLQQSLDRQPGLGGSVLSSNHGTNCSSGTAMSGLSYNSSRGMTSDYSSRGMSSNYSSGNSGTGETAPGSIPMAIMGTYGPQLLQQLQPQAQPLQQYSQLGPALELRQQRRQTEATGRESLILPWRQDNEATSYLTATPAAGGEGGSLAANVAATAAAIIDGRAAFSDTTSDTANVLSCSSYTERAFREGGLEGFNRLTLALEMGLSAEDAASLVAPGAQQAPSLNGGTRAASLNTVSVGPSQVALASLPGQQQTMLTSALLSVHESASGSGSERGLHSLLGNSDVGGLRSVLDLQSDLASSSSRSRPATFGDLTGRPLGTGSMFSGWPPLQE